MTQTLNIPNVTATPSKVPAGTNYNKKSMTRCTFRRTPADTFERGIIQKRVQIPEVITRSITGTLANSGVSYTTTDNFGNSTSTNGDFGTYAVNLTVPLVSYSWGAIISDLAGNLFIIELQYIKLYSGDLE